MNMFSPTLDGSALFFLLRSRAARQVKALKARNKIAQGRARFARHPGITSNEHGFADPRWVGVVFSAAE